MYLSYNHLYLLTTFIWFPLPQPLEKIVLLNPGFTWGYPWKLYQKKKIYIYLQTHHRPAESEERQVFFKKCWYFAKAHQVRLSCSWGWGHLTEGQRLLIWTLPEGGRYGPPYPERSDRAWIKPPSQCRQKPACLWRRQGSRMLQRNREPEQSSPKTRCFCVYSSQSPPCVFGQINGELITGCGNSNGDLWTTAPSLPYLEYQRACPTQDRVLGSVWWMDEWMDSLGAEQSTLLISILKVKLPWSPLVLLVLAAPAATDILNSSITDINCKLYFCIVNSASSLCI